MLRGTLDLFEICEPDESGHISSSRFRKGRYHNAPNLTFSIPSELQIRVPDMNIDAILNLRSITSDGALSFLDFWEAVDDAIGSAYTQRGMFFQ